MTIEINDEARLLELNGEPMIEPVVARGLFVLNTVDEIRQAFVDIQNGAFRMMPS